MKNSYSSSVLFSDFVFIYIFVCFFGMYGYYVFFCSVILIVSRLCLGVYKVNNIDKYNQSYSLLIQMIQIF